MTMSHETTDTDHESVEFVRLGRWLEAEFLVEASNLPTFRAMMEVVGRWLSFDPELCRETIGELFTYANRLRFGYKAFDSENTAPFIDVDLPRWDPVVGPHRELTPAELVTITLRWIYWACDISADVLVRQAYGDTLFYNKPGPHPVGIRLTWT